MGGRGGERDQERNVYSWELSLIDEVERQKNISSVTPINLIPTPPHSKLNLQI